MGKSWSRPLGIYMMVERRPESIGYWRFSNLITFAARRSRHQPNIYHIIGGVVGKVDSICWSRFGQHAAVLVNIVDQYMFSTDHTTPAYSQKPSRLISGDCAVRSSSNKHLSKWLRVLVKECSAAAAAATRAGQSVLHRDPINLHIKNTSKRDQSHYMHYGSTKCATRRKPRAARDPVSPATARR